MYTYHLFSFEIIQHHGIVSKTSHSRLRDYCVMRGRKAARAERLMAQYCKHLRRSVMGMGMGS